MNFQVFQFDTWEHWKGWRCRQIQERRESAKKDAPDLFHIYQCCIFFIWCMNCFSTQNKRYMRIIYTIWNNHKCFLVSIPFHMMVYKGLRCKRSKSGPDGMQCFLDDFGPHVNHIKMRMHKIVDNMARWTTLLMVKNMCLPLPCCIVYCANPTLSSASLSDVWVGYDGYSKFYLWQEIPLPGRTQR